MNKTGMKYHRWFLISGIILVLMLPHAAAEEKQEIKRHNFTWAVSAGRVIELLKQKEKPVLVYVRGAGPFNRAKIPCSINLPLYAVKAKPYLKQHHVILFDEGYDYGRLAAECQKLNEMGFKASILFGGLNAWAADGGEIEGDQFVLEEIKRVSPRSFHLETGFEHHWVIDVSEEDAITALNFGPNRIYLKEVDEAALRAVFSDDSSITKGQDRYRTVVVASKNGLGYDKVEKILQTINVGGMFYLDGGFDAYHKYLEGLLASRKPRENRIMQQNCNGCGKRNRQSQ